MIAHDVLTYLCAIGVGLKDVYVEIKDYTYSDCDPGPYNPEYELEMRDGKRPSVLSPDPLIDEDAFYADFVKYNPPKGNKAKVVETLSLYSAEPDWGMDEKLELSPFQKFTGDSLGYRHMRYGMFNFRAGIAHLRAIHFTRMAQCAFRNADPYWGIRFSGCALHYIEDLLTPLHTKPFPEWFFLKKLLSTKRFDDIYLIAFNYHHSFERYTGYHLWHGENGYIGAIENAPTVKLDNLRRNLLRAWRASRRIFYPIFREWKKIVGKRASTESVLLSPEDVACINPSIKLRQCIERWLGLASGFVKGYISGYVAPCLEDRF